MATIEQCEQYVMPLVNTFEWNGKIVPLDGMGEDNYAVQVEIEGENETFYPLLDVYQDAATLTIFTWWYGGIEHICWTNQEVRRTYRKIKQGWFRHGN